MWASTPTKGAAEGQGDCHAKTTGHSEEGEARRENPPVQAHYLGDCHTSDIGHWFAMTGSFWFAMTGFF